MSVAVAAPHTAALESARAAVAAGGSAIDAALAAASALTVVYPHQCSLGGDLIALVRSPDQGVRAIVSAGAAPEGIDVARLAASGSMPKQGPDTVTVPGVVAGWRALWELGAKLPWGEPLRRAAGLADGGFPVSAGLARAVAGRRDQVLADDGMLGVFGTAEDGALVGEGDLVVQPALAATLRSLASDHASMYRGAIPEAISSRLRSLGGAMTSQDFARHTAEVLDPIEANHGGARWWVAPPPTQGAVLLGVVPHALGGDFRELVPTIRDAILTRQAELGDPRGGPIRVEALLDPVSTPGAGLPPGSHQLGDTVAVVAASSDGTIVTLIQSVYQWFGSGILDPTTGIVLHNRGSAFSVDPAHPAHIGPWLRPPHTLLPLIVQTESLVFGLGCQGGSAQPWILAQLAPALLEPTVDPAEVLSRPRFVIGARDLGYSELTLVAEPGCEPARAVAAEIGLAAVTSDGPIDEAGHAQLVRVHHNAHIDAASDPRADGAAEVFESPPRRGAGAADKESTP